MFSVIIPTKNEESNILRCINSVYLSLKNKEDVEVIVVDNGSCDDTVELAKEMGAYVIEDKNKHVSGLRNLGARKAKCDYLAFLDADCAVRDGWLENAYEELSDEDIGIVGEFPCVPSKEASWIENAMYGSRPLRRREVSYLGSCNMIMRRRDFVSVGGFCEEAVSGEDYIICQHMRDLGKKVIAVPSLSVVHYGYPKTLRSLFAREVWHGMGMIDLYRANRITLPLVWSVLNIVTLGLFVLSVCLHFYFLSLICVLMFLLFPFLASVYHSHRNGGKNFVVELYAVFFIYGLARTFSLSKIVSLFLKGVIVGPKKG